MSVNIDSPQRSYGTKDPIPLTAASTSVSSSAPQFRYIFNIYDDVLQPALASAKVYPNKDGLGVLDVSRMFSDFLTHSISFDLTGSINLTDSIRAFYVKGQSEYSTSSSGSLITTGEGASFDLENITLGYKGFPNEIQPNGDLNFIFTNHPQINYPTQYSNYPDTTPTLQMDDYFTLTLSNVFTSLPVEVSWVDANDTVIYSKNLTLAPENASSPSSFTSEIGLGPKNLTDYSGSLQAYFDDTDVDKVLITYPIGTFLSSPDQYFTYNLAGRANDTKCSDDYVRFAFVNYYGVWDYYSIYNPVRRTSQVERSIYKKTQYLYDGTYTEATALSTTPYLRNRGNEQYKTDYSDTYEVTTDYLSSMTSEWLKELFESELVYVIEGDNFIPVNILNTSVERSLDTSRNKIFQYTVQYKLANDRQSR